MILFVENESRRNFSNQHYLEPRRKNVSSLKKLVKASHPYFIQNDSKSINIPINYIDCNRIFDKINELEDNSVEIDEYSLWLPHHHAVVNVEDMTAIIENNPE